ncbi:hypothetical protein JCGZ_13112 [Jatropha curcas]|uniref:Uncharacterized protein n=1 Tax=Jatropha curcas TaxID=180498 RepID=A0A067K8W0_JATCU|nr:hypothetical protein JCGZ_13112 [Jatropha curcas]
MFIDMSISPGLSSRQCPDRYTFCVGCNLPNEEFHHLRIVIVTIAVHWGFDRWHQVTNFLYLPALSRRQPPIHGLMTLWRLVFLVNSRPSLVTATPFVRRHPFSRSYRAILPSSLERVASRP